MGWMYGAEASCSTDGGWKRTESKRLLLYFLLRPHPRDTEMEEKLQIHITVLFCTLFSFIFFIRKYDFDFNNIRILKCMDICLNKGTTFYHNSLYLFILVSLLHFPVVTLSYYPNFKTQFNLHFLHLKILCG